MFQRVVRSVGWIIALRIMQLSLSLVRVTVLAYILVPYDFGLIGLSFLTTAVLEAFSQSGFYPALIQKQENIRPFLDTAWTVLLLRGFALFIFIYLVAPYVAIFFNIPALKIIIQITGISFIIQGFHNVGVVYFQKDLQFHKQLIYQFSGAIIDCIVAIVFAFMFRNVWAIIIGFLAGDFVRLLVSYSLHPFRPHFELNFKKAGELFKFGKWVLGSSALGFFINRGDEAFAGKLFGATTLGFYQIGHKISDAPATELTHTIFQVTLPAYSKLQDNIQKLQEAYLKVFQLIAFFSFLIAGLIIILIPDFIKIFLGDKWLPMLPIVKILVFAGLFRSLAAASSHIFYAIGKPRTDTLLQIMRLFILAVAIYPLAIRWGALGVAAAAALSIFVVSIGFSFMAIKITQCGIKKIAKMIFFPLVNISIAALFTLQLKTIIGTGVSQFVTLLCVAVASYILGTFILDRFFNYGIKLLIKDITRSFITN